MKEKAVIILSGGIDSSTLCYKYAPEYDVHGLSVLYGQRHSREIQSAKQIAERLNITHKIIDLTPLGELLSGSALTDRAVDVPEVPETVEHYNTLKSTIVPNRNAILLSVAIGYAGSIGAEKVYFGAHHSDRGVYPDCRKEFVDAFEIAERLANDNSKLTISAPFIDMDKSQIVALGNELGVPFKLTWTCYNGGEKHCGRCSSCKERKRSFIESGVEDPTDYEN